jgi:Rieske Fe-S protein
MDEESIYEKPISRRAFCVTTCQAASLAALGGILGTLLQACTQTNNPADVPSMPTINSTVSNGTIAITTASGSPIASVGSAAIVQYGSGSLLIAHTAASTFIAVSAICTHQGCLITGYSGGSYSCPCHGSTFNTNGQVTRGPATANLKTFATSVGNDQVVVTV